MKDEHDDRDPERDPALAELLIQAYGDEPLGELQAEALRRRVRVRAAAVIAEAPDAFSEANDLARVAGRPSLASPGRTRRLYWAAPALLAATIAGVLLVGRHRADPGAPPAGTVGFATAEQALTANVSDADFARTLTRADDPAALLRMAVAD